MRIAERKSLKHQIPGPVPNMVQGKHQITNKLQSSISKLESEGSGHLDLYFGDYLGFVIWNLGFQNKEADQWIQRIRG